MSGHEISERGTRALLGAELGSIYIFGCKIWLFSAVSWEVMWSWTYRRPVWQRKDTQVSFVVQTRRVPQDSCKELPGKSTPLQSSCQMSSPPRWVVLELWVRINPFSCRSLSSEHLIIAGKTIQASLYYAVEDYFCFCAPWGYWCLLFRYCTIRIWPCREAISVFKIGWEILSPL